MSELLKLIEEPGYQTIKLLSGKSLDIRGWLMKEEKDFLFAVETRMDDRDLLITEALKLAKKCIAKENHKSFDELSRNDLVFTLAQMRKLSKGNEIDFSYRCSNDKCSDWMEFNEQQREQMDGAVGQGRTLLESKISIDDDIIYGDFNTKPVKLERFNVLLKEVSYTVQRKLEKKYIKEDEVSLNAFNFDFVMASIAGIEIPEGKVIDDFTDEELIKFIDSLPPSEFQLLTDGVADGVSEFTLSKKVKCPLCKNESEVVYDELFSLMVFS